MAEEILEPEQITQDPPSKALWQKLYDSKAYTKTFEEFQEKYNAPESIEALYQKLSAVKAYRKTQDDFVAKYFPQKKSPSESPSPSSATPLPSSVKKPSLAEMGIKAPEVPEYMQGNQPASTAAVQPKVTEQFNDFRQNKDAYQARREQLKEQALDNTAKKILKLDPAKELSLDEFAQVTEEKKKLRELHDQGELNVAVKDGEVGFKEKVGWLESTPATLMDASIEDRRKASKRLKYFWNQATGGIGSGAGGLADPIYQLLLSIAPKDPTITNEQALKNFREEGLPTIRTALTELVGAQVPKNQEEQYNKEFFTSAIGGLAASVPAMISTKGVGLLFQSYDGGLKNINSTEAGKALPENVKTVFGLGTGLAGFALEKVGLNKIFGKQSSKVANGLAAKTLVDLVKKSDGPITTEMFEQALTASAKSVKDKFLAAGGKIKSAALVEFATGSAQEAANILAEGIVNKTQGQVFEPTSWGEKFSRVLYAGAQEAVGGGIMGASSIPFAQTRNYIAEKVAAAKTPEDIASLKSEVLSTTEGAALSKEEAQRLTNTIDNYVRVNQKVPADAPDRKVTVEKIIEREGLEKEIEKKKVEMESLDAAFQPELKQEIEALKNRSEVINQEINPTENGEAAIGETNQSLPANAEQPAEQAIEAGLPGSAEPISSPAAETAAPILAEGVYYQDRHGNQVVTGEDGLKTVLNKKGKEASAPTRRKVLTEHLAEMDFSTGERAPEPPPDVDNEVESWKHITRTTNNPTELVEVFEANQDTPVMSEVELAISRDAIGKINRESFKEVDDGNNINQNLALSFFSKDGQSLDQVAAEISGSQGIEVTPQDVADFMKRFPGGEDPTVKKPNAIAKDAAAKFEQLTGFPLTNKVAEIVRLQASENEIKTQLTPEETEVANTELNDDIVKQIIADEGLTLETLDANRNLFNGFPYTPEDFENVKNELNENGRDTTESEDSERQGDSDVEDKEAGAPSETDEADKGVGSNSDAAIDPEVEAAVDNREKKVIIEKMGLPGFDELKKLFTSNRGLPNLWVVLKDMATGDRKLAAKNMRKAIYKLKDAVKAENFKDVQQISDALADTKSPAFLTLSTSIQVAVKEMRAMVDGYSQQLVVNGLVGPGQAITISNNIGEYLNRSYKLHTDKKWIKKVGKDVIDDAIKFLTQQHLNRLNADPSFAHLTSKEKTSLAVKLGEQSATDILTLKENPKGQRYAEQFSKDLSALKQRKDIPPVIRKLMGEYTDPVAQFAITISKLATLHSQAKLLNELKTTFKGQLFFDKNDVRPEGFSYEVASDGSESWNPLAGMYTNKNTIEALQEAADTTSKWQEWYQRAFGFIKKLKTVYSPATQAVNFTSNPFIALANGHFRMSQIGKSWTYYKDTMFNNERGSDEVIDTLIQRNVIGQSVDLGIIKNMFKNDKADEFALEEFINPKRSNWNPMKWVQNVDKIIQKQYGASDSFWKVYGFMNEATSWADALYGKGYKDLDPAEKFKIDEIASERVKNCYPSYDRALPGLMWIGRNVPFVGNFVAYQAEVLRTIKNNILYAKQDIQSSDPKVKAMGAKRIAGIVSYISLKQGINYAAVMMSGSAVSAMWAAAFGDDDEEDKRKSLDKYVPNFLEMHNLMVEDKGAGKFVVYDIDRMDPYNAVWHALNGFKAGEDGGPQKAFKELYGPFVELDMIAQGVTEINDNEDKRGNQIYNKANDEGRQFMEKVKYMYGIIEPSAVKLIERTSESDTPAKEFGLSMLGARGYDVDVVKNFGGKMKAAEVKLISNSTFNYRNKEESEKEPLRNNFKRIINNLHRDYLDAIKLGASPDELDPLIHKKFSRIKGSGRVKNMVKTGEVAEEDIIYMYEKAE